MDDESKRSCTRECPIFSSSPFCNLSRKGKTMKGYLATAKRLRAHGNTRTKKPVTPPASSGHESILIAPVKNRRPVSPSKQEHRTWEVHKIRCLITRYGERREECPSVFPCTPPVFKVHFTFFGTPCIYNPSPHFPLLHKGSGSSFGWYSMFSSIWFLLAFRYLFFKWYLPPRNLSLSFSVKSLTTKDDFPVGDELRSRPQIKDQRCRTEIL